MNVSFVARSVTSAKQRMLGIGLLSGFFLAPLAWSDSSYEEAEVVAVSPHYETVTYTEPREECRLERVAHSDPEYHSSTPKLVGAVIGGALGNALGAKRPNRQVGAAVGGLLGYSIGKDVARHKRAQRGAARYRRAQVCEVYYDRREQQQLSGYDVTYTYAGRTYHALLNEHPGDRLRVKVSIRPL